MTDRNLFYCTKPGFSLPGVISIKQTPTGDVHFVVRSSNEQNSSSITLTDEQFRDFIIDMVEKGYANPI